MRLTPRTGRCGIPPPEHWCSRVSPRVGPALPVEYGEGVLRIDGKTVGYYSISSASVGLTFGSCQTQRSHRIHDAGFFESIHVKQGWSIGADTGVAMIHGGGGANYDTETLKKPVVGFVFGQKGLIGDLSLEGSKIDKIDR